MLAGDSGFGGMWVVLGAGSGFALFAGVLGLAACGCRWFRVI